MAAGFSLFGQGFGGHAQACSNIFINHPNAHIDARSMDFGLNIAMGDSFGFIGQGNTTDVIIDADKIPAGSLTSWTVRYGYWGRNVFHTPKLDDGMNTEGLSLSGLYLESYTRYPVYDPSDKRPVIGVFDIGNFLLSQAKDVAEAVALIDGHQIVQSAIEIQPGVFLKNIPIHFVLRDRKGKSAVVEFVGGKTNVYRDAGNVFANGPVYPEHLAVVKKYDGLHVKESNSLSEMPGGFDSPDRFARGYVLTRNMPPPSSTQEALYQADFIISSLSVPYFGQPGAGSRSNTIWKILKDLDHGVVYTNNIVYFQGGGKISPTHVVNGGYTLIDLKSIDFKSIPRDFGNAVIRPTPRDFVKKILTASEIPEFGE